MTDLHISTVKRAKFKPVNMFRSRRHLPVDLDDYAELKSLPKS